MKMKFDCLLVIIIFISLLTFISAYQTQTKQFTKIDGDKFPDDAFLVHSLAQQSSIENIENNKIAHEKKTKITKLNEYIQTNLDNFQQMKMIINNDKGPCFNIFNLVDLLKKPTEKSSYLERNKQSEPNQEFINNIQSIEFLLERRKNFFYNDEYGNLLIYSFNEDLFDKNNFLKLYFVSKM